jgi:hypothetical protein
MKKIFGIICITLFALIYLTSAHAEGDITRRAERLAELEIDALNGFSVAIYTLETGVYYRWRIVSDGLESYELVAGEFFQQSWIDKIVIEDQAIKPAGLYSIEFDDEGEVDVWFVPIRPGQYKFYVKGLELDGFAGEFIVK